MRPVRDRIGPGTTFLPPRIRYSLGRPGPLGFVANQPGGMTCPGTGGRPLSWVESAENGGKSWRRPEADKAARRFHWSILPAPRALSNRTAAGCDAAPEP